MSLSVEDFEQEITARCSYCKGSGKAVDMAKVDALLSDLRSNPSVCWGCEGGGLHRDLTDLAHTVGNFSGVHRVQAFKVLVMRETVEELLNAATRFNELGGEGWVTEQNDRIKWGRAKAFLASCKRRMRWHDVDDDAELEDRLRKKRFFDRPLVKTRFK